MSADSMNQDEIQAWIVTWLAKKIDIDESEIELDEPVVSFGLSSVEALKLLRELESKLDKEIPITAVMQYPTIRDLAGFIVSL